VTEFEQVELRGARFHQVVMRGAELVDVQISGLIHNVVINGVDVVPLINAELDRRYPERIALRPDDPAGFRDAWILVERFWDETVARARQLPPELLHESVDGEWSFVETLRHLVFATDAWIRRVVLGDPSPWHPLDLPFDELADAPGVPRDREARPSLDEVLALRRDRMSTMRDLLRDLTEDQLKATTEPVTAPGWPPPDTYSIRECLLCILDEEWAHHQYATRDLTMLETR
jgi:hypothetical protein